MESNEVLHPFHNRAKVYVSRRDLTLNTLRRFTFNSESYKQPDHKIKLDYYVPYVLKSTNVTKRMSPLYAVFIHINI